MAANQRLRRAIMDENGGWPDACAMRIMHTIFASYSIYVAANQRLWRAIMDENDGGGAGRFVGAFATGDRAEADKTAVACDPV